jgi:hypothetical protein
MLMHILSHITPSGLAVITHYPLRFLCALTCSLSMQWGPPKALGEIKILQQPMQ